MNHVRSLNMIFNICISIRILWEKKSIKHIYKTFLCTSLLKIKVKEKSNVHCRYAHRYRIWWWVQISASRLVIINYIKNGCCLCSWMTLHTLQGESVLWQRPAVTASLFSEWTALITQRTCSCFAKVEANHFLTSSGTASLFSSERSSSTSCL